jgi:hypothetical protein
MPIRHTIAAEAVMSRESEERRVILLEFVAAFAIVSIFAIVLYMVFIYRPL